MSRARLVSPLRGLNEDVDIDGGLTKPEEVPKGIADGYEPYRLADGGALSDGEDIWRCCGKYLALGVVSRE